MRGTRGDGPQGSIVDIRLGPATHLGQFSHVFAGARVFVDPLAHALLDQTQTRGVLLDELEAVEIVPWQYDVMTNAQCNEVANSDRIIAELMGKSIDGGAGLYLTESSKIPFRFPSLDDLREEYDLNGAADKRSASHEASQQYPIAMMLAERHPVQALLSMACTLSQQLPWTKVLYLYLDSLDTSDKCSERPNELSVTSVSATASSTDKTVEEGDDWETWESFDGFGNEQNSHSQLTNTAVQSRNTDARGLVDAIPAVSIAHIYPSSSFTCLNVPALLEVFGLPFTSILVSSTAAVPQYECDGIGADTSDVKHQASSDLREIRLMAACMSESSLPLAVAAVTLHVAAMRFRRLLSILHVTPLPTLATLTRFLSSWFGNGTLTDAWRVNYVPFVMYPLAPPISSALAHSQNVHTVLLPSPYTTLTKSTHTGMASYDFGPGIQIDLAPLRLPNTCPTTWPIVPKISALNGDTPDARLYSAMPSDVDVALRLASLCLQLKAKPDIFFHAGPRENGLLGINSGGPAASSPSLTTTPASRNTNTLARSLAEGYLAAQQANPSPSSTQAAVEAASSAEAVAYHIQRFYRDVISEHKLQERRGGAYDASFAPMTIVILERASDLASVLMEEARRGFQEDDWAHQVNMQVSPRSIVRFAEVRTRLLAVSPKRRSVTMNDSSGLLNLPGIPEVFIDPLLHSGSSIGLKCTDGGSLSSRDHRSVGSTTTQNGDGWDWDADWVDVEADQGPSPTTTVPRQSENHSRAPVFVNSIVESLRRNDSASSRAPNAHESLAELLSLWKPHLPEGLERSSTLPYFSATAPSPTAVYLPSFVKDSGPEVAAKFTDLILRLNSIASFASQMALPWPVQLAGFLRLFITMLGLVIQCTVPDADEATTFKLLHRLLAPSSLSIPTILAEAVPANLSQGDLYVHSQHCSPGHLAAAQIIVLHKLTQVMSSLGAAEAHFRDAITRPLVRAYAVVHEASTALLFADIASFRLSAQKTIAQAVILKYQYEQGWLGDDMLLDLQALQYLSELIDESSHSVLTCLYEALPVVDLQHSDEVRSTQTSGSPAKLDLASAIRLAVYAYSIAGPKGFLLEQEQALERAFTRLIFASALAIETTRAARNLTEQHTALTWLPLWLPSASSPFADSYLPYWAEQWLSIMHPNKSVRWSILVLSFVPPLQTAAHGLTGSEDITGSSAKFFQAVQQYIAHTSVEALIATADSNPLARYVSHSLTTYLVGVASVSRLAELDMARADALGTLPMGDTTGLQGHIREIAEETVNATGQFTALCSPVQAATLRQISPTELFITRALLWFAAVEERQRADPTQQVWLERWKELRFGTIGASLHHTSEMPPSYEQNLLPSAAVSIISKAPDAGSIVKGITQFVASSLASTAQTTTTGEEDYQTKVESLSNGNALKCALTSNRTVLFFVLGGVCSEEVRVFQETVNCIRRRRRKQRESRVVATRSPTQASHDFNFFDEPEESTAITSEQSIWDPHDDDDGGVKYLLASTHVVEGGDLLYDLGRQLNHWQEVEFARR